MSSISNELLTIMLIVSVFAVIVLFISVISLYRRVRKLSTPKFGFLGKPLYVAIFAVLAVATIYVSTNLTNQHIKEINAGKEVKIDITTTVLSSQNGYSVVNFVAVPSVNGVEWGDASVDTFDMYWSISGKEIFSQIKQGLNENNTGTFNIELKQGEYTVSVITIYNTKTYEASTTVSF